MYISFDGMLDTCAPAAWNTMSISRPPPRIFIPFTSSGTRIGWPRDATEPDCQIHVTNMTPFSSSDLGEFLADRRRTPFPGLVVVRDQSRHETEIGLLNLASRIGQRVQGEVERAFAQELNWASVFIKEEFG